MYRDKELGDTLHSLSTQTRGEREERELITNGDGEEEGKGKGRETREVALTREGGA